ncbi:hypothetical protein C2G38_2107849 [Gigaspora rosea]|uniref:Uncharacterized protein n=1 Tax=Gigaspora rosea TaxID=44941 RepID=A0A397UQL7_9GLOM|nr:hypothetical protein C2G38_2107849 [Gigaspora rosea]
MGNLRTIPDMVLINILVYGENCYYSKHWGSFLLDLNQEQYANNFFLSYQDQYHNPL